MNVEKESNLTCFQGLARYLSIDLNPIDFSTSMKNVAAAKSKFAPAERYTREEVLKQNRNIAVSEFLDRVMAQTPFMFIIINDRRQVVYSNHLLMNHLGFKEMDRMIGFRPGELFRCIHAHEEPGGCGTSESCRYCGAIGAVLESKKQGRLVIKDCILNMDIDGKSVAGNYQISSKPFEWKGEDYFVVTLEDISSLKRKEQLEKTFFHDIKNKAGTVYGFLNLLKSHGNGEGDHAYLGMAFRGITELLEDIEYQRILMKAESGDLEVYRDGVPVQSLLRNICLDFQQMAESRGVTLTPECDGNEVVLYTDPILINRVVSNLVKNAVEASSKGDGVVATYSIDSETLDLIVRNPLVMSEEVRLQIFNRSFSTKGTGRGIGSYSIKLLTEEYLGGKVSFTSSAPQGTEFRITLPFSDPEGDMKEEPARIGTTL